MEPPLVVPLMVRQEPLAQLPVTVQTPMAPLEPPAPMELLRVWAVQVSGHQAQLAGQEAPASRARATTVQP